MLPSLRLMRVLAATLAASGVVCLGGAVLLFIVVRAQVEAAIAFWPFALFGFLGWGVLTAVVLAARWHEVQRERELGRLAEDFSRNPALSRARPEAAKGAERHLRTLAERLDSAESDLRDARKVGQALLQVGSHYALLCTLDGRVVDANAAVLARTGLSPDALKREGASIVKMLRLRPLLELARRSLEEDASLGGIAHGIEIGGEVRPVEVALRGLRLGDEAVALIVMSDRAHEAQLERQIGQFTDAVELMVDQRVARITAGRDAAESILSQAGVALFEFDHSGHTEKLNPAAELLTGRTQFTLQTFEDVAQVLLRGDEAVRELTRWFFADVQIPRIESVRTPHGRSDLLMLSGAQFFAADAGRRLLVAFPLPEATIRGDDAYSGSEVLERLSGLAASLNPTDFAPEIRAIVGVIREAARRLDDPTTGAGDGAAGRSTPVAR